MSNGKRITGYESPRDRQIKAYEEASESAHQLADMCEQEAREWEGIDAEWVRYKNDGASRHRDREDWYLRSIRDLRAV